MEIGYLEAYLDVSESSQRGLNFRTKKQLPASTSQSTVEECNA